MSRANYAELIAELYEAVAEGWPVGSLVPYARSAADGLVQEAPSKAVPEFRYLRAV